MSSGGWQTVTTKDRLNKYGPVRISQARRGEWGVVCGYVSDGNGAPPVTWQDGITYQAGRLTHCGPAPERVRKERAKVRKFAGEFMAKLEAGKVPHPSAGDCWYCGLRNVGTGKPVGECFGDKDHIVSHLKERYYVPSLLLNASAEGAGEGAGGGGRAGMAGQAERVLAGELGTGGRETIPGGIRDSPSACQNS